MAGIYHQGVQNALRPIVRHVRFEFGVPLSGFEGFRILHLADLHIDGLDGLAEVAAQHAASLEVDLCVMTGDYRFRTDGPCDAIYPRMKTILSAVRARHGIVGILGNHDSLEIALELEKLGVRMLINEAMEVGREGRSIWLAGVDDPHDYRSHDIPRALREVPPEEFTILLAHSPELFREAAAAGVNLYICGHTHAGQIRVPWLGAPLLNVACPRAYTQDRWRHGDMHGYTSAGLGCSMLPVRFNCAPEIAIIEIGTKAPVPDAGSQVQVTAGPACEELTSAS